MSNAPGVLVGDVLQAHWVLAGAQQHELGQVASGVLLGIEPVQGHAGDEEGQPVLVPALGELLVNLGLELIALLRVGLEGAV